MLRSLVSATLVLGSVALSVGLAELVLRLAHYGEQNSMNVGPFMVFDPLLGWFHKRGYSFVMAGEEYRTTLQYDPNGVRGLDPAYNKPQGVSRIIVLGDSFVDGYTVPTRDRITEVLQSSLGPRVEVINLGVAGYSTDQELLLLETQGWKYQPDLVILAFYFNDVWMNIETRIFSGARKPVFIMGEEGDLRLTNVPVPYPEKHLRDRFKVLGLIRTIPVANYAVHKAAIEVGLLHDRRPADFPPPNSWAEDTPEDFAAYRRTQTAQYIRAWSITRALLRRMKRDTEQRGARFVVFYVPARVEVYPEEWRGVHLLPDYDSGVVTERLAQACKAEGIPYIDPSDRFREAAKRSQLYYLHDPHWNTAGHRLAGQVLAGYLQEFSRRTRE